MPDRKRNLHTSISAEALRLAHAQAALEGRSVGEVIDAAVTRYCRRLAEAVNDILEAPASTKSDTGGVR